MFSVAVSIPYNKEQKMYDMSQVPDTGEDVRNAILKCDVYEGTRVVAATVLRWPNVLDQCPTALVPWSRLLRDCGRKSMTWAEVKNQCSDKVRDGTADHAEYRTLQHFNALVLNHNRDDLLLFYVLASPCTNRCTGTGRFSILNIINPILNWNNYAVVFSNIFQPRNGPRIPEAELREALERLGTHKGRLGSIGLRNIFRCNAENVMQCTSCSSGGQVSRYCYSENAQPAFIRPQPGRSDSRSPSGGRGRRSNSVNPHTRASTHVGSNAGQDQGSSRAGKGRRRRRRGKKRQSTDKSDNLSQNGWQ